MTQVTTQVDNALDFDEDESVAAPFWGRLIPIVAGGRSTVECLTLTADEHIVSRSSKQGDSALVIANPRISSRHAKFVHNNGSDPVLEDLSTNGTWVNGERLGKGNERILKTGDTVAFINPADTAANADGTTTFTFIVAGASDSEADEMELNEAIVGVKKRRLSLGRPDAPPGLITTRFSAAIGELVLGEPAFAAFGLEHFMRVSPDAAIPSLNEGIAAIVREVSEWGNETMKECLDYVLNQPAGSSKLLFPNSPFPRDCDANGLRDDRKTPWGAAMRFSDFVAHPDAVHAKLHAVHVLALRLYTTSAFVSINTPLRVLNKTGDQCAEPHPFPNIVRSVSAAIKQLRSNNTDSASGGLASPYLYRGFKDRIPTDDFMERGGSELATMSTTSSLEVALRYASSAAPMLLRLKVSTFVERGADISFCSAFPAENEVVYPPMTFILPERIREIDNITVIDVAVRVVV